MGIYAADGSLNVTVSDGSIVSGIHASDGSFRVTIENLQTAGEHPGYVSGGYYPIFRTSIAAGGAPGANSIRLQPFWLPQQITLAELGCRVSTLDAAGLFQLALYNSSPSTKLPTTLVGATADMSGAAAVALSAALVGGNKLIGAGLYYAAMNCNSATLVFVSPALSNIHSQYWISSSTIGAALGPTATNGAEVFSFTQTYGTWPDLSAQSVSVSNTATCPLVGFKVA